MMGVICGAGKQKAAFAGRPLDRLLADIRFRSYPINNTAYSVWAAGFQIPPT